MGALLAKTIHDATPDSVLFICHTGRALDQFLKHLTDNDIPDGSITRLGSKTTGRLKKLNLSKQFPRKYDSTSAAYIDQMKSRLDELSENMNDVFKELRSKDSSLSAVLNYLEFSDDSEFFDAFSVPKKDLGTKLVNEDDKRIKKTYLIERWAQDLDAGYLQNQTNPLHASIWKMTGPMREDHIDKWKQEFFTDLVDKIVSLSDEYSEIEKELENYQNAKILREKRIIACTTTAAAKYTRAIHAAKPAVIIVEEAGQILESHLLALMGEDTKQLIMIGDHKQLRPKVSNYALTAEKGDGFDLNISLFERLINRGFPYASIWNQHRMRPGISRLLSTLAYPALTDSPKTLNLPRIRGLQDQVMFINHDHPESDMSDILDVDEKWDPSTTSAKQNLFEAKMVARIVHYLNQQGYRSNEMVVLTPYLGQLSLLRDELSETNDPVLGDLDAKDLIQTGLLNPIAVKPDKEPIRISTIGKLVTLA
jgi:superfamily I DNA and/or RNA helicase